MSIFVVDDEPILAAATAEVLKLHGYSSVAFTDPNEALEAVKCGCPRLLIVDMRMPGMSGLDLAIRTREVCAGCGVILFTGLMITPDLHDEVSSRGFLVIRKPSPPAELFLAVKTMLGG